VSLGTQLGARYSFAACFSAGSSAIDLETGATRMIEATTIDALSSIALLIAITLLYPTKRLIHVFLIGRAFPCAADIVGHHHTGAPTIWKLAARTRTAMASPSIRGAPMSISGASPRSTANPPPWWPQKLTPWVTMARRPALAAVHDHKRLGGIKESRGSPRGGRPSAA